MTDCFLLLLNLSSFQCEPSNSKGRFVSPVFLKEEQNLKTTMIDLVVLRDKWKEWSFPMPNCNVHLDN